MDSSKELSDKIDETDNSFHNFTDIDDDDDKDLFSEDWQSFLDKKLDEKSKKTNLTAVNVRSIIYQVITNKDVQVMFRNQLKSGKLKERLHEAIFEPKMTRSKLQEVLKSGKVPPSWKIMPSSNQNKSLLDIDFGDEEDDDDYSPAPNELEHVSDDESASSSSRASECGSPMFPRSILSSPDNKRPAKEFSLTPNSKKWQSDDTKTLMGPPKSTLPIKKLILHNEESQHQRTEEGVALRTRSKVPLKDTSLTELENKIVDPDLDLIEVPSPITEDQDWLTFLAGLSTDNPLHPDDEDTNDPEFNFIVEEDKEKMDKEEIRFDKGVQISKKEMNLLIDELMEVFNNEDISLSPYLEAESEETPCEEFQENACEIETESGHQIPNMNVGSDILTMLGYWGIPNSQPAVGETKQTEVITFSEDEKIQLRVQMTQHVQLLAQTYICSAYSKASDLQCYCNASKYLLHEINDFKTKFSSITPYSFFNTPNLSAAIEITNQTNVEDGNDELESEASSNLLSLNFKQMDAIANSCAFVYPAFIPKYRMVVGDDQISKMFLKSEDGLLALGLHQFALSKNKFKFNLIRELLLPTKTENQIVIRIGNMKRRRGSIKYENPLTYFLNHDKLPKFERSMELLEAKDIIPPIQMKLSLLPNWFTNYLKLRTIKRHMLPYQLVTTKKLVPRKTISRMPEQGSETLPLIPNNAQSLIIFQVPSINPGIYGPQPIIISNVSNATQFIPQVSNPSTSQRQAPITSIPMLQAHPSSDEPSNHNVSSHATSSPSIIPPNSTIIGPIENPGMPASHPTAPTFPMISNHAPKQMKEPRRVVTFVQSPKCAAVNNTLEVSPPLPQETRKELQVTTSTGVTLAVKTLENSNGPCVVLSHEQLKALGLKIDLNEKFQQIEPSETINVPSYDSNPLFETAVTETTNDPTNYSSVETLNAPAMHPPTEDENALTIIQTTDTTSEIINNQSSSINKLLDLSVSSGFFKDFELSSAFKNSASTQDGNAGLKQMKSFNGTFNFPFGDVSLNSSDAMGFHNLEDLMSCKELSRIIGKNVESDDSLCKLAESQMGDIFCNNSLIDNLINMDSNVVGPSGVPASMVDSCTKNAFNEISLINKRTSLSGMLECFSSENVISSTPITRDSLSKKTSQILTFSKEEANNYSGGLLKKFNEAYVGTTGTSRENPSACNMSVGNGDVLPPTEPVANDDEEEASACVDENLKVALTADETENYDPQLRNIDHNEPDLMDHNATLCTPKKFCVNEYDNVKKLSSPATDVVTPCSNRDEMSPNSKKQSSETIAQLEKLISPPKSPLDFQIASLAETPRKISECLQTKQNQNNTSPFKKRFSNFQPKQLDFCSLDGANDQKEAQKSKLNDSVNDKPRFRKVAPKPPFIKITGELPKSNKKPLGRRKTVVPVKKPTVEILPKLPNPHGMTAPLPVEELTPRFNYLPGQGMFADEEGDEDENVRIAELMSASTTIDKKATAQLLEKQKALRQKERQDLMLSLLDNKLMESDPMRSRREMLYAESYISRVKERFKHRPELFSKFNQLLFLFTTDASKSLDERQALEVHKRFYGTLRELFKDHNDLLSDYAGFLPLDQAASLGCFIDSLEFEKARIFMTKLEKYFKKKPQTYHRCLKALMDCRNGALTEEEMRNFITKQIRNNPHLITEFSWFFPDDRPQTSHNKAAFEEIDLCSENETMKHFEKLELPGENYESFGTTNCSCACHTSGPEQSSRKSRHCASCNLKTSKGKSQSDDKSQKHASSSDGAHKSSVDASKELTNLSKDKSPSPVRPTSKSKPKPAVRSRFPDPVRKGKSTITSLETPLSPCKPENISEAEIDHRVCDKQIKKQSPNVCPSKPKNDEENKRAKKNATKCRKKKDAQSHQSPHVEFAAKVESGDSCDSNEQILNQMSKRKRYVISSSESESEINCKMPKKKIRKIDDTDQILDVNYSSKTVHERRKVIDDDDDDDTERDRQEIILQSSTNLVPSIISCHEEWSREEDEVLLENCKTSGCDSSTFKSVALLTHRTTEDVEKRFEYLMELYSKMDSDSEL